MHLLSWELLPGCTLGTYLGHLVSMCPPSLNDLAASELLPTVLLDNPHSHVASFPLVTEHQSSIIAVSLSNPGIVPLHKMVSSTSKIIISH